MTAEEMTMTDIGELAEALGVTPLAAYRAFVEHAASGNHMRS